MAATYSAPMNRYQTLLIEDDPIFREQVTRTLFAQHQITAADKLEAARELIRKKQFDIVLIDKFLPDGIGTSFIPELRGRLPHAVIIVMTADKTDESIFEALNAGASDYLPKGPTLTTDLAARIQVAIGRIGLERRLKKAEGLAQDRLRPEMVGSSSAMRELRTLIAQLSGNRINVLITGESGTGKELIARAMNLSEGDPSRPLVTVNCGAIPENLVESELFGHVKGAFTGAISDKVGKFELANGGDLFLDEIGELSTSTQVKLLRVLQDGDFTQVGSNEVRFSRPRVISATNRNLVHQITHEKFRQDLFYRINAFEIRTVPLRERKQDIPELIDHFLQSIEGPRFAIKEEALALLVDRSWPGNIRELKNTVDCAVAFCKARHSCRLNVADFKAQLHLKAETSQRPRTQSQMRTSLRLTREGYRSHLEDAERDFLLAALEASGWNPEAPEDLRQRGGRP